MVEISLKKLKADESYVEILLGSNILDQETINDIVNRDYTLIEKFIEDLPEENKAEFDKYFFPNDLIERKQDGWDYRGEKSLIDPLSMNIIMSDQRILRPYSGFPEKELVELHGNNGLVKDFKGLYTRGKHKFDMSKEERLNQGWENQGCVVAFEFMVDNDNTNEIIRRFKNKGYSEVELAPIFRNGEFIPVFRNVYTRK